MDVDWDREQVNVSTFGGEGIIDWEQKLSKRTVTTGCGQGTVFSCTLDKLYEMRLPEVHLTQSSIYGLLKSISSYNEIYKQRERCTAVRCVTAPRSSRSSRTWDGTTRPTRSPA